MAAIVTCSSAETEYLRRLRSEIDIPVLRIDEPMARCAAAAGRRILAMATFEPTIETTRSLLLEHGAAEVRVCLVPGAYAALLNGDGAGHDQRVIESLARSRRGFRLRGARPGVDGAPSRRGATPGRDSGIQQPGNKRGGDWTALSATA